MLRCSLIARELVQLPLADAASFQQQRRDPWKSEQQELTCGVIQRLNQFVAFQTLQLRADRPARTVTFWFVRARTRTFEENYKPGKRSFYFIEFSFSAFIPSDKLCMSINRATRIHCECFNVHIRNILFGSDNHRFYAFPWNILLIVIYHGRNTRYILIDSHDLEVRRESVSRTVTPGVIVHGENHFQLADAVL